VKSSFIIRGRKLDLLAIFFSCLFWASTKLKHPLCLVL